MNTGIIYCVHCLATGKKYIGQTTQDLKERIYQHISTSKIKKSKFYNAVKKYSWKNFVFGIIEECSIENIHTREIYWIEKLNTYNNGYNSTLGGDGASNPTKWKKVRILNPNNILVEEDNITIFCKKYNLSISNISQVLSGKRKSHKGWKLETTVETKYELIEKSFKLKSPTGKCVCGKNIRKFSIENNLCPSTLTKVILGKRKSHKGWSLAE